MSYNIFLDDVRRPETAYSYMQLPVLIQAEWIIVRNYYAFISLIQNKGVPDMVAFDHDLADEHYKKQDFDYNDESAEKTGYHCAKWLIDYCMDNDEKVPTKIIIHSMNPVGSENIKSLFETYYRIYNIEHDEIQMNPYFRY